MTINTSSHDDTAEVVSKAEPKTTQSPNSVKKKEKPKTILELIEFAYSEPARKLSLTQKDLGDLKVQPASAQSEIEAVRRLAAGDPLLAVPFKLLAALAEVGAEPVVRSRILDLVLTVFACHKLFEKRIERLTDPHGEQSSLARELNESAKTLSPSALGLPEGATFSEGDRARLRVNVVSGFELLRLLRDRRPLGAFIEDMAAFVWDAPAEPSVFKSAALLANAKNNEALSQLSRHFEELLRASERETDNARILTRQQELRAISAEASGRAASAELEAEKARSAELAAEVIALKQRLSAEQNSRVVDNSHLVNDYEGLRTQVIRRLSAQVELLGDGLHAIRNGSTSVAEEFVDRALSTITGEVARLKSLDGTTP